MHPAGPPIERSRTLPLMTGLDGVRALAVIAVVLYHLEVGWLPAGFLGVDVFFVVSGFLITSLLVADIRRFGHFDVRRFWVRRARRLFPALILVLVGVVAFTALVMPDELRRLRGDVLAAVGYVTNWALIYSDTSYFDAMARPPLLRHLWSLAVEEQFYLLWPLAVAAGWALLRRRMLSLVWLGALLSVALMAVLYEPLSDPSRVYFGTDTRAVGLLVGAGLAFITDPARLVRPAVGRRRVMIELAGWAGLAGLAAWMLLGSEFARPMYRGGFLAVSLASAALIVGAAAPTSVSTVLGIPVLGWIGRRSYGIYLWHWPVIMVTRPQLDVTLDGWALGATRIAVTVALAAASYRFVERPIIEKGVAGWMRGMLTPRPRPTRALAGVGGLAVVASFVAVLVVAPTPLESPPSAVAGTTPATTTTAAALVAALPDTGSGRRPPAVAAPVDLPVSGAGTVSANIGGPAGLLVEPDRRRPPPEPASVTAIGDSVMLGAADALRHVLGDTATVDAEVSRSFSAGADMIGQLAQEGALGDIVVVHLGTNGPVDAELFDTLMANAEPAERVLAVTVRVPRRWEAQVNETLAAAAERWPGLELVDWKATSDERPELFVADGVHLTDEGRQVYAALVEEAVGPLVSCVELGDCEPAAAD
jgi:peptidoglycan/LPS O-acetylase OafA/YrhL